MGHEYYHYNREELLKASNIPLEVYKDKGKVFEIMAEEMAAEIKKNNAGGEKTVFICPVGPIGQYPFFVDIVNTESISLRNCWFINMDEYMEDDIHRISMDHPLSFRGYMDKNVYSRIRPELVMPKEQRIFPDPADVEYIPGLIDELGGVDICFGGIGINGHLAFNEPDSTLTTEEFKALKTRVLPITAETRTANAIGDFGGALEDMPKYCITIGFNEIFNARKIRLGIFRDWHRAVVRRAAYGEKTSDFPVSILAEHQDVIIRMSEWVANLEE